MAGTKRRRSSLECKEKGISDPPSKSFERTVRKLTFTTLTLAAEFVRKHGDQIRECVKLKSDEESMVRHVKLNVQLKWAGKDATAQVTLGGGWAGLVDSHSLRVGDQLTFHLVGHNEFLVNIWRCFEG